MFSKAPVIRFNDVTDQNPPLGYYDPKFITDLSISATSKGHVFVKPERSSSRSSYRSASPANSHYKNLNSRSRSRSTVDSDKKCQLFLEDVKSQAIWAQKAALAEEDKKQWHQREGELVEALRISEEHSKTLQKTLATETTLRNSVEEENKKQVAAQDVVLMEAEEKLQNLARQWTEKEDALLKQIKEITAEKDAALQKSEELSEKVSLLIQEIKDTKDENTKHQSVIEEENKKQVAAQDVMRMEAEEKLQKLACQWAEKEDALLKQIKEITAEKDVTVEKLTREWTEKEEALLKQIKEITAEKDIAVQKLTRQYQEKEDTFLKHIKEITAEKYIAIQKLTREWTEKEDTFLKQIKEITSEKDVAVQKSEEFSKKVSVLIQEIKQTRDGSNQYQNKILDILNLKANGLANVGSIVGESISKSGLPFDTTTEERDSDCHLLTPDFKDNLKKQIEDIKNCQQESVRRRESYNKQLQETGNWLSMIEKENKKQREQIALYSSAIGEEETLKRSPFSSTDIQRLVEGIPLGDGVELTVDVGLKSPESPQPKPDEIKEIFAVILKESKSESPPESLTEILSVSGSTCTVSDENGNILVPRLPQNNKGMRETKFQRNNNGYFGGICCSNLSDVQEESEEISQD